MRFLSLIVGLVLGFFVAAWFYGAGGALAIAGKQIGPDILEQPDFHSDSSGRASPPGPQLSTGGAPPSSFGGAPPSSVGGTPHEGSPVTTLDEGATNDGEQGAVNAAGKGDVNMPAVKGNSSNSTAPSNSSASIGDYIKVRWPK